MHKHLINTSAAIPEGVLPPILSAPIHFLDIEDIDSLCDKDIYIRQLNPTKEELQQYKQLHTEWFPLKYDEYFYDAVEKRILMTFVAVCRLSTSCIHRRTRRNTQSENGCQDTPEGTKHEDLLEKNACENEESKAELGNASRQYNVLGYNEKSCSDNELICTRNKKSDDPVTKENVRNKEKEGVAIALKSKRCEDEIDRSSKEERRNVGGCGQRCEDKGRNMQKMVDIEEEHEVALDESEVCEDDEIMIGAISLTTDPNYIRKVDIDTLNAYKANNEVMTYHDNSDSIAHNCNAVYILTLGVAELFRRHHIGRKLVMHASRWYSTNMPQIEVIYLHVVVYNKAAIKFYESLKFHKICQFQGYYNIHNVPYDSFLYAYFFDRFQGFRLSILDRIKNYVWRKNK